MAASEQIRQYAREKYIEPARRRGELQIKVRAGDVHKELTLKNRVPTVCQALSSEIFLRENNLILEGKEGPPSGLSTSVVFTYRAIGEDWAKPPAAKFAGLMQLYGIGQEVFASLGGGENFLRSERLAFAEAIEKIDREHGIL